MIKRTLRLVVLLGSAQMLLGTGGCLPNDYWSGFAGTTLTAAVGQVLQDFIGDTVDVKDPAAGVDLVDEE